MTIEEVKKIRDDLLLKITKEDNVFGQRTAEALCVRLDNDVILNGRNCFLLWNDSDGILAYLTHNEKTGTNGLMVGTGGITYPAILSLTTYDNIQEIWIPLQFDSFGQALAVLKANGNYVGYQEHSKPVPIDDDVATKMKQKLFDSADPSKSYQGSYYSGGKIK